MRVLCAFLVAGVIVIFTHLDNSCMLSQQHVLKFTTESIKLWHWQIFTNLSHDSCYELPHLITTLCYHAFLPWQPAVTTVTVTVLYDITMATVLNEMINDEQGTSDTLRVSKSLSIDLFNSFHATMIRYHSNQLCSHMTYLCFLQCHLHSVPLSQTCRLSLVVHHEDYPEVRNQRIKEDSDVAYIFRSS